MLIYVLAAIVVVLLMILFRYLPRRIFLIFVALLEGCAAADPGGPRCHHP